MLVFGGLSFVFENKPSDKYAQVKLDIFSPICWGYRVHNKCQKQTVETTDGPATQVLVHQISPTIGCSK